MGDFFDRRLRALAAALLLAAPSAAVVVEPVRVERPAVGAAAAPVFASALAPSFGAPSLPFAPSVAPSAAAPSGVAWDDARRVAARLGAARGVPATGHAYFYEMLGRYLYNGRDDAALAELARRPDPAPVLAAGDRWASKAARDLEEPYDDAAALARLDHLQKELEDFAAFMRGAAPGGGYSILVMGGLLRGRLSAHSDVDLMLKTEDAALLAKVLASPFGYLTKERDAVVGPVPKSPALSAAMGEIVDAGDGRAILEDPAFLRRVFFRARAALAAAPMERDAPLDAALMARIKDLGRRLDEAREEAERRSLEDEIEALAAELPPPAAPLGARPARFVPVGSVVVDLSAPGAAELLKTVGSVHERPVIGLYRLKTARVVNAFALGTREVYGHSDALPPGADRREYAGWCFSLKPDGRTCFAPSGSVFGELTPRLRRAVRRHLGVGPASETRAARWLRRALDAWDRLTRPRP